MSERCVFCEIVGSEAPAAIVLDREDVIAFMDAHPVNPGHILVIPKRHAANLSELDPEDGGSMFRAAMEVASGLRRSEIRTDGINLVLADGSAAGQEIYHVHLHVIPRFPGDNFSMSSRTRERPGLDALDSLARSISMEIDTAPVSPD